MVQHHSQRRPLSKATAPAERPLPTMTRMCGRSGYATHTRSHYRTVRRRVSPIFSLAFSTSSIWHSQSFASGTPDSTKNMAPTFLDRPLCVPTANRDTFGARDEPSRAREPSPGRSDPQFSGAGEIAALDLCCCLLVALIIPEPGTVLSSRSYR